MPRINFKHTETFNDVEVNSAFNPSGDEVDVSNLSADELVEKLESGELYVKSIDYDPSSEELDDFESAEFAE